MDMFSRRSFLTAALATTSVAALPLRVRAAIPAAAAELARTDAVGQAALLARGEVSARELVEAAIARIEALNPQINAILTPAFDRALGQVADGRPSGPLGGVPFLVKDLMEYPPLRHTAGSRLLAQNVGDFRSPYVEKIDAAGLVVLGTTTTPEFGLVPVTEPLLTGPTKNPWDVTRTPGGSSGGAGAAVASGMLPLVHASDGGGSIRFPAACCGVFGLKPSRGRNPQSRKQQSPLSVENCFSRTVRDTALYMSLTERRDAEAPYAPIGFIEGPSKKKLRIGVVVESYVGTMPDTETAEAVQATAKLCEGMGHTVEEVTWPFDGHAFNDHFLTVWGLGAAGIVKMATGALGRAPDESILEPWTLGLAAKYGPRGEEAMKAAFAYFAEMTAKMDAFFERYDLLLTPVTPEPAPKLGYMGPDVPFDTLLERVIAFAAYTPWQNATGSPAVSVPLFQSKGGLPIGVQFTAKPGGDGTLVEMGYALEAEKPWAGRWAPVSAVNM